jgi:hypothetical protein
MKYILSLMLSLSVTCTFAQQFPGTDSLRNYNNRFITGNASQAFTNLRLHNLLDGMIDFLDTALAGSGSSIALGLDTIYAANDSTLRYRKQGVWRQFTIKGIYDHRKKVDTIYRANDSTLNFTINGFTRSLILQGTGIMNIRRRSGTDSVEYYKNSAWNFAFIDSTGGGTGGGLTWIQSATAPTGGDTSKIWVKTPAIAGVHDVYQYSLYQFSWVRYGWLTIDGFFSPLPPINIAGGGQSNMGGQYPGGDTARVAGILAYTSGSANGGIDDPTHWEQAAIGKSPFFLDKNNFAFAFAKNLRIKEGRIVRIVLTYAGGTSLSPWLCGTPHYLLDTLENRVARSGIDTLHAFLWHQGEGGGCRGNLVGGYMLDLKDFYDTLCVNTGVKFIRNYTQFIAGELGGLDAANRHHQWVSTTPNGAIRALNFDMNPNTASVISYGLSRCDDTHFCGTALDSLGYYYYTEFKNMPHTPAYEQSLIPGNFDTAYEDFRYDECLNLVSPAGIDMLKFYHNSFAWNINGANTLTLRNDNTVGVGAYTSLPGTNTSSVLKVAGRMSLSEGSSNSVIATNFNPNTSSGGFQRNYIWVNYTNNWTTSLVEADNVFIGANAGRSPDGTRMSLHSVFIGTGAGNNIIPAGSGDYNIGIGYDALNGATSAWNVCIGSNNGKSSYGGGNTLLGHAVVHPTNISNISVLGYNCVVDSATNQAVVGDIDTRQLKTGKIRIETDVTPSNGHILQYDATTSEYRGQALPASITSINSQTGPAVTITAGTGITTSTLSNDITIAVDVNNSSLPHTIATYFTDASNTGTGETDLYSTTVGANKLISNGQTLYFDYTVNVTDITSTAEIKVYFAGTQIATTGAYTVTATGAWKISGSITRATSTTARATVVVERPGTEPDYTNEIDLTSQDFTIGNIVKITGQAGGAGGGSGDIVGKMGKLYYQP